MTEQTIDTVNPGQAIYDALSDEAKAAVDALPDGVFAGDTGEIAASHFAVEIQKANESNDAVWSIQCDGHTSGTAFVVVNVGSVNTASWSDQALRLVVDREQVDTESWAQLAGISKTDRTYASYPYEEIQISAEALLDGIPKEVMSAHESALSQQLAQPWQRNQRANWHRDDWRVKLAMLTGRDLPVPSYVPEGRVGLTVESQNLPPSSPERAAKRFWKISAGRGAADWPLFRAESIIALSWYDELFDPSELPKDREEFTRRLRGETSVSRQGAELIWTFRDEVTVGDAVLVYSQYKVLAHGRVTGRYRYEREQPEYRHRRSVQWDSFDPLDTEGVSAQLQSKLTLQQTLVELTAAEFAEATRQGGPGIQPGSEATFGLLNAGFASAGLAYTESQIASFYTALQTKGFVILSGISGTGKSKIAQHFADMLPTIATTDEAAGLSQGLPEQQRNPSYRVKVRDYMGKYQRFHIPVEITATLPLPEPGTAFNVPLAVNGVSGEARIRVRTSSGAYLFPKGKTRTEFVSMTKESGSFFLRFLLHDTGDRIDSVEITSETFSAVDSILVGMTEAAIRYRLIGFPWSQAKTFPFPELAPSVKVPVHLPGITVDGRLENPNGASGGSGIQLALPQQANEFIDALEPGEELVVTPIVRDGLVAELRIDSLGLAGSQVSQEERSNHLFLPVRPDWRDGKALIGYHNPLSGEYVRTNFLDFVISAAEDYVAGNRNAFFVILDEMNLAHVEYYFADVLSVIESGRDAEGWTVEGIPLAVGEEDADLPETLRLPPNLYIVGTVNMDETTHPFSPKVLDRAFTIELTEVDFSDYPPEQVEAGEMDEAEKQALLEAFTQGGRYPRIDKTEIAAFVSDHEKYRDALQSLNTSLRRSRMHFGYRVFDEIMQFAYNAETNWLFTVDEAFDHAVLMKVLPKFNGSRGKLQNALFELIHWCRMEGTLTPAHRSDLESRFANLIDQGQPFDQVVKTGEDSVDDNWRYPATGKRAALMMQDLYTDGFASFG